MVDESTTALKVRQFIAEEGRIILDQVVLEATVQDLLGWQGDDAADLLMRFAKSFKVDLVKFPFTRHFYTEAECIISCGMVLAMVVWGIKWILGKRPLPSKSSPVGDKQPLFIWQLVEAAEKGYWPHEAVMADR